LVIDVLLLGGLRQALAHALLLVLELELASESVELARVAFTRSLQKPVSRQMVV
jgi:hypothetical protein